MQLHAGRAHVARPNAPKRPPVATLFGTGTKAEFAATHTDSVRILAKRLELSNLHITAGEVTWRCSAVRMYMLILMHDQCRGRTSIATATASMLRDAAHRFKASVFSNSYICNQLIFWLGFLSACRDLDARCSSALSLP